VRQTNSGKVVPSWPDNSEVRLLYSDWTLSAIQTLRRACELQIAQLTMLILLTLPKALSWS
jgi:hypothetical protein